MGIELSMNPRRLHDSKSEHLRVAITHVPLLIMDITPTTQ